MSLFDLFRKRRRGARDADGDRPRAPQPADEARDDVASFRQQLDLLRSTGPAGARAAHGDDATGGEGEFGRSPTNPIPCRAVFGSTSYLARLRAADGAKVRYERIGTVGTTFSARPVDAYRITDGDGRELATLYLSPHHAHTSGRAPSGFMLGDPTRRR